MRSNIFSLDLAKETSDLIAVNPAAPAVALNHLKALLAERESYLNRLQQIQDDFVVLGIESHELTDGNPEIGFLLPRTLFDNELSNLIRELSAVQSIIRAFSELTTGSAEPIEVKQISTSDPLFFFGLAQETIIVIGAAVTWALNTWKQVEQIRKLRSDAAKIAALDDGNIQGQLEEKIKTFIAAEITSQTEKLVGDLKETPRKNEQRNHVHWALEAILSRVERGWAIEIKMIPPTTTTLADGETLSESEGKLKLWEIASQLSFPPMDGPPITQLPPPSLPERTNTARQERAPRRKIKD
ncbi:hypothetical protein [Phyllobacterium endophyticum]|uniref:Uncharacterized protein n=1 Tax=Phyllobacterium endophyticum TaxID=1149773 RepID=A0A2P7AUZ5_9HYPH|nr:hypothetical protein [Phyllobacterium endophyticum]MBB3234536.1 hypothetical protein [Phyllobacterium endophyticum]PSH58021.1 hypothetical protein CU100_10160 [Phyllobacterium endophyticum]TYR38689.1 hypothetical protein FY050_22120 [Phyllobacterium endophyticum]